MSLVADPEAFGSSFTHETARPRQWWQDWARESEEGTVRRTFVLTSTNAGVDASADDPWVGIALVRRHHTLSRTAVLNAMWIAPEARGLGGSILLCQAAEQWARALGLEEMILKVVAANRAAQRAYRAAGFKLSERIVFWAEREIPLLVMQKPLTAQAADRQWAQADYKRASPVVLPLG